MSWRRVRVRSTDQKCTAWTFTCLLWSISKRKGDYFCPCFGIFHYLSSSNIQYTQNEFWTKLSWLKKEMTKSMQEKGQIMQHNCNFWCQWPYKHHTSTFPRCLRLKKRPLHTQISCCHLTLYSVHQSMKQYLFLEVDSSFSIGHSC